MEFLELNATQSYLLFVLVFFVSILLARLIYYIFKHPVKFLIKKSKSKLDDIIVDTIEEPIVFLIVIFSLYLTWRYAVVPEYVYNIVKQILWILILLDIAYFIFKIFDIVFDKLLGPLAKASKSKLDDQLVPIFRKIIKIIILIFVIIIALDNFGVDVAALVAGLGIGGIAIAFAAKDTLSSILGSFVVLGDKPFQIGDIVKVGEVEGKIKEVGLRSTRIITWDSTEIIVPNSEISSLIIENISKRKGIRKDTRFPLYVGTKVGQIEKAEKEIEQALKNQKGIDKEYYVLLDDFPDRSMSLRVIFWVKVNKKYFDYVKTKNDVNMKIIKILEKNKIKLLGI